MGNVIIIGESTVMALLLTSDGDSDGYDYTTDSMEALRDYVAPISGSLTNTTWTDARAGYLDELAAANIPADLDAVLADTNELQTDDIPGTLTTIAGYVDTEVAAIKTVTDALTAAAAAKIALSAAGIVNGSAAAGTLSTTQMTTDLTEATNDHYNGRVVIWTSGVLAGQASDITDYDGASKMLTYTAITEAPSASDTFVIL